MQDLMQDDLNEAGLSYSDMCHNMINRDSDLDLLYVKVIAQVLHVRKLNYFNYY
jgi:hypothetical protein